jgi:hypothetical protein
MAFDAATGEDVLFGGITATGTLLADTWTWNGSAWTKQFPATHPPENYNAAMAYDAAAGDVVLYGGKASGGLSDATWTWDGSNWTQQAPASTPSIRNAPAMSSDPATGGVILFGGQTTGYPQDNLNDTWIWNGTDWVQQSPAASPPGRYDAVLAPGPSGNVVLFGGLAAADLHDTWIWG